MHLPAARRALAEHTPALAILVLFLGLSRLYLLATPPFEAPDEPAHYAYIRYLVDERSLPPLIVSSDPWEQGEMHQPPLYYALAALAVAADGVRPADDGVPWREAFPRNPHAALGEPGAPGNRNAVLHRGIPTGPPSAPCARPFARRVRGGDRVDDLPPGAGPLPRRRAGPRGDGPPGGEPPVPVHRRERLERSPGDGARHRRAPPGGPGGAGKDRPVATPLGMGLSPGWRP